MPDWKSTQGDSQPVVRELLKRAVRDRIAPLHLEGSAEFDLTEELAQHLEDRYDEYRSGGFDEGEATRKVVSELDDMYPLRAALGHMDERHNSVPAGEARRGNFMEDVWGDLRYALRTIRKSPMFVLFVVLTLALGIGANTTVFTVINTLILNPLPVSDPPGLAAVGIAKIRSTSRSSVLSPMSFADLKDYEARNGVFRSLAGYTSPNVLTWKTNAASERVFGELVTGNYFSTLGLTPARGRFFLPEEDSAPGAHSIAVMNYGT